MSEFENIPEKIEEMAQEEIVQAEEAAEAIEEAVEEAIEMPVEIAEEVEADVAAEVSMGETVPVVSEAAEEIVAPAEPIVPELEPAADAAMNFMKETDEFATEYLKETMPGVISDTPAEPIVQEAPVIQPAPEAAAEPVVTPEPVWQPVETNPLPPENVDFGSKPFAQDNFAPTAAAVPTAPATPAPPVQPMPQQEAPVPPVQPMPQQAAPVPPVAPVPPMAAAQPVTAQDQFQQYQAQQNQRAAQMNQQFQQYQQRQGVEVPPQYQNHPYTSQEGQVGGFATGYTGGADTAWQSQPNNIEAKPNPSYAQSAFAQQMGPQNPSETQNNPYSGAAGGFATGYVPGQQTSMEGRGTFGDYAGQGTGSPYGAPNYTYQQPASSSSDPGYTMALISMICGIVSCVMFWMRIGGFFALLAGIAAIILGIMSGKRSLTGKRNGMATAGLICGIIGISLTVIAMACWACACSYLASTFGNF